MTHTLPLDAHGYVVRQLHNWSTTADTSTTLAMAIHPFTPSYAAHKISAHNCTRLCKPRQSLLHEVARGQAGLQEIPPSLINEQHLKLHFLQHQCSTIDNCAAVGVHGLSADVRGVLTGQEDVARGDLTRLARALHLCLGLPGVNHLLHTAADSIGTCLLSRQ